MKLLRLLLFALIIDQLSIINCNAQWVNRGLTTTEITGFANIGNNIFVGTDNFGTSGSVYLSTNNGATWSNVSAGIPSYLAAYAITTIGSKVIVGTSGQGPYVSTDNGSSWTKVDSGLPSFFLSTAFAQGGGYLYMAGDGNGVYRSADQGVSWTQVYNMEFDNQVNAIAVDGSYVYVATENDVEVSPDGGNTWHLSYIQTFDLLSAAVNNSKLYVGSYYGYPPNLSMSPDSGKTWIELDTGLPMNNTDVFGMAFAGTDIFLATNSGIYLSKDEGAHWVPSDSGLNGTPIITCMFINNGIVYAGADTPAVWQQPLADFHCFTGPTSLSVSICAGSSYPFNGKQLTKTGTYTDTLPSFQGCDSVVTLRLTVVPNDTTVLNESVCAGFTYYFFGANESQTGIYTHLLQNVTGCDSLVVLNLTVNSEPHSTISPPGPVAACKGSGVTLDAGAGFTNYFWNTNATTETINVSQPGTYYCIVFYNNCQSPSDTVTVTLSNLTASFTDAVSERI